MNWADYAAWVGARLETHFETLGHSGSELVFTRHVNGDVHTLVIEKVEPGDTLRTRVTLESYPD